jgi:DNA-binding transcriptional MerR regulator
MPDQPLLRIGAFSRASSLSVKTLRTYHEAGLLVPDQVDPVTGYRSYSVAQVTDAVIIRRLRELDVPLEAIRQVVDSRNPGVTKKVLSEHGAVLEGRLAGMQRRIDDLYAALAAPVVHTPAGRRLEPARAVLSMSGTVTEAEWLPFLERAHRSLHDAARMSGAVINGAFGACYPTLLVDDAQEITAYLPIAEAPLLSIDSRSEGVAVGELPAAEVAVLVHRGSYDDLPEAYLELGKWVAAHAEPAELPVREVYLVGTDPAVDDEALRTEICWPIRSTNGESSPWLQ